VGKNITAPVSPPSPPAGASEATRRVLVRKGLVTNEEVLEEIKVVRREMEGTRRNPAKETPLREADRRQRRSRHPLRD